MEDELEKNIKENIEKVAKALATSIDEFKMHKMLLFDDMNSHRPNDNILELILENYFRMLESWPFSTDKALFVIKKMKESIEKQEYLSLQEKYKDEDKIAYWCPKTLYNTKEAFQFLEAYITMNFNKIKELLKLYSERMKDND